jgi:hypothetical protein
MRECGGCGCVVSWDFEEAQVSFSRDALDQSGRALPKIYLSQERQSSNRSRFDRIISPSVTHTRLNLGPSNGPPLPASRHLAFR